MWRINDNAGIASSQSQLEDLANVTIGEIALLLSCSFHWQLLSSIYFVFDAGVTSSPTTGTYGTDFD